MYADEMLSVETQSLHYFGAVETEKGRERTNFIGEGNFQRMKGVKRIFHQFGSAQPDDRHPPRQAFVKCRRALRGCRIIAADDDDRGFHEISDCTSFTEKFRIGNDIGFRLERSAYYLIASSRKDGAAYDHSQGLRTPL